MENEMVTVKPKQSETPLGRPTVKMGYIHYFQWGNEYFEKAMENVEELGTFWLTHKPFMMIDSHNGEERKVWGDDWNDRPAELNCGSPYGGEKVSVGAGDLVIVIKPAKLSLVMDTLISTAKELEALCHDS